MAKNKRKGNNKSKQGQKKQKGQESGSNGKWKNWKLIVKESKRFEEYYKVCSMISSAIIASLLYLFFRCIFDKF